jgi:hypothetical protein
MTIIFEALLLEPLLHDLEIETLVKPRRDRL